MSWLGALVALLILVLADVLPFVLRFVRPDNLYVCLVEVEVFFVLVAWPLLMGGGVAGHTAPGARWEGLPRLLLHAGVLLVAAMPLALVCANVSGSGVASLWRGQLLVGAHAAFVAALHDLARNRGWRVGPWYFAALVGVGAALPFLSFLAGEFGRVADHQGAYVRIPMDLSWFSSVSPFWGALLVGGDGALLQTGIYGVLALALGAAGFRSRPRSLTGHPSPGAPEELPVPNRPDRIGGNASHPGRA